MTKSIGRRRTINRTGNKSSGKVKAQQLVEESTFVVRASTSAVRLTFPTLTIEKPSKSIASGVYLRTKSGKTLNLRAGIEVQLPNGEWQEGATAEWTIKDGWGIHGFFLATDTPVGKVRLRLTGPSLSAELLIWGYAAGTFRDLVPAVEKDIRANDPKVNEERLAQILALIRKQRFKYFETAYLAHAPNTLTGMAQAAPSKEVVTCKYCSLCERLLPVVSFHSHSMFSSGYQLECKACKNCNINMKLNYKRTKQQLLESSLIRRELEYLAQENVFIREHPDFIRGLYDKFENKCFNCGAEVTRTTGHVDHTRPLVALWPLDEHASILCTICNNEKHDKFPIEFYRDAAKRRALSAITGLPLADLEAKRMNMAVLRGVIEDVPGWYGVLKESAAAHADTRKVKSIPDRSFRAVARRAKELENIDLYELYKKQARRPFPGKR